MSKVYIAGPMRGIPELNFPAFDRAAKLGRSLGWDVINPAEMDRQAGINHEDQTKMRTPAMVRGFMQRDIPAILSLRAEDGDAIAMLPGWPKSALSLVELSLAKGTYLMVLDALTFLPLACQIIGQDLRPHHACPSIPK